MALQPRLETLLLRSKPKNIKSALRADFMFLGLLQRFALKRTTVKFLKGLLCKPFKNFTGSGLSAKRCNTSGARYITAIAFFWQSDRDIQLALKREL